MSEAKYNGTGIDVHGHAVPAALVDEAKRAGARYGGIEVAEVDGKFVLTFPAQKPLRPVMRGLLDLDQRTQWLDQERLEAQLVAPWLDVAGYQLDVEDGANWISFVNNAIAELARQSKGRLFGVASLHLGNPTNAVRELERATRELGLVGAILPTHYRHGQASDPAVDAVWEAAASLGVPVILHPPIEGPASAIPDSTEFRSLYGRPLETTFVAARLLANGVLERYPGLKLVLVHGGGFLPFQGGRLDNYFGNGTLKGSLPEGKKPSDYLATLYYDTVLIAPPSLEFLVKLAGPDHVLLGSDYPLLVGSPPTLEAPLQSTLDASSVRMIARENAAALFGLPGA